jgi:3',5'-cyclic AMP phosphodiesterase CpdA
MSDLHIGYKGLSNRLRTIVDYLIEGVIGNPSDFIIVITGDLVDNAKHSENYMNVIDRIIDLKEGGFDDILVVPGNHDYGTGSRGDKKYVNSFKQTFFSKEDIEYPIINIIDKIAFIGLDSMAEELHWYDRLWAEGELGKNQLQQLKYHLESNNIKSCKKRVIYLHHHPFDWKPLHQLKDSNKLRNVLLGVMKKGITIDAILYGHNHEGKSNNGYWEILRCYDAGSVTSKPRSKLKRDLSFYGETKNSTRVIDLNNNPNVDYELTFPKSK